MGGAIVSVGRRCGAEVGRPRRAERVRRSEAGHLGVGAADRVGAGQSAPGAGQEHRRGGHFRLFAPLLHRRRLAWPRRRWRLRVGVVGLGACQAFADLRVGAGDLLLPEVVFALPLVAQKGDAVVDEGEDEKESQRADEESDGEWYVDWLVWLKTDVGVSERRFAFEEVEEPSLRSAERHGSGMDLLCCLWKARVGHL